MTSKVVHPLPPTRSPTVTRPVTVTIIAVLSLLVGGGGILVAPVAILAVMAPPPTVPPAPGPLQPMQGISFLWFIGSYCASVLLLAAGYGLLKMRRWAWWLAAGCAAYNLLAFFLSRAMLVVLSIGAADHRGAYLIMLVGGTAIMCLPKFVLPTLTLFVLFFQRKAFEFTGPHDSTGSSSPFTADLEPARPVTPTQSPSIIEWIISGPALPAYQRSETQGSDGIWKWAVLLAPISLAVLIMAVVILLAEFETADRPRLIMGSAALIAGTLALAGALFEWRWFFENRSARGVRWWAGDRGARWLYTSVAAIILLSGFGLVGYTAMPSMLGKNPLSNMGGGISASSSTANPPPGNDDSTSARRSPLCGGTGGSPFERSDSEQRLMLGLRYELADWEGKPVIGKLEPVFDRSNANEQLVIAKEGYCVGGLNVDSGNYVNAVQIIFVRTGNADAAEPDEYSSEWIGTPTESWAVKQLGGDGRRAAGIFGRQGIVTDAVGLLFASDQD